jgi:hypothetical protein
MLFEKKQVFVYYYATSAIVVFELKVQQDLELKLDV